MVGFLGKYRETRFGSLRAQTRLPREGPGPGASRPADVRKMAFFGKFAFFSIDALGFHGFTEQRKAATSRVPVQSIAHRWR